MGLLSLGTPLPWEEAKEYADHVRQHGIQQFINTWNRVKARRKDNLLWGDEVEYVVVHFDDSNEKVKVSLSAHDALEKLQQLEVEALQHGKVFESSWKPEYGRYMLEATPGLPYGATLDHLLEVEPNMIQRRKLATETLGPKEAVLTITNFPRLGCCEFTEPVASPTPDSGPSMSLFIPNQAINPHARFPTLTANIRIRRGSKVAINMPIYKDVNTPTPFLEAAPACLKNHLTNNLAAAVSAGCSNGHVKECAESASKLRKESLPPLPEIIPDALPDHIYMDAMCFGMGCCCLQVTFQACSVEEARRLYDQLAVITPIMMALSAGAPIFRGYLADVDCRWNVISGSVDDRTAEERGLQPLVNSRFRINKSRYDSISLYLSPGPNYSGGCSELDGETDRPVYENTNAVVNGNGNGISSEERPMPPGSEYFKDEYNDLNPPFDKTVFAKLVDGGIDERLAKHYAHLFIRDPLVIFRELLDQDNELSSDHFENIQSTNWQTMRFKPPPPSTPSVGWRVEFRSMEIQLTDKENAAFSIFVVLLVRAILSFGLNFYIPLSKVDENMKRAHHRDAVHTEKFWFRHRVLADPERKLADLGCQCNGTSQRTVGEILREAFPVSGHDGSSATECEYIEMTVDEIMNGKKSVHYPGLVPLVRTYLSTHSSIKPETRDRLNTYIDLISRKASGALKTGATWMREFVTQHVDYKGDSVVSEKIAYDLCRTVEAMAGKKVPGLNY
ncbi:glutamate-cysteine ligase-domain-containing protein [Gaertneriomyces semiglobifer]|nr:glutamate-cysteine ligase-domain-containing protein [Gaertneriomyces semiglobifer]